MHYFALTNYSSILNKISGDIRKTAATNYNISPHIGAKAAIPQ